MTVAKALGNMARENGERLEAKVFPLKSACVGACSAWKTESAKLINTFVDWVHQNNPHPW